MSTLFSSDEIEVISKIAQLLKDEEKKIVAFVGTGMSKEAGLYDWKGLLGKLASSISREASLQEHKGCEEMAKEGDYYVAEFVKAKYAPKYIGTLQEVFGKNVSPCNIHRILAQMPFAGFVTTNYDTLLEDACKEVSLEIIEGAYPNQESFAETMRQIDGTSTENPSRPFIIHIHGRYREKADACNLILTPSDYQEHYWEKDALRNFLEWLSNKYHLLFLGFSFRDMEIRRIFELFGNLMLDEEEYAARNENYALMPKKPGKFRILVDGRIHERTTKTTFLSYKVMEVEGKEYHCNLLNTLNRISEEAELKIPLVEPDYPELYKVAQELNRLRVLDNPQDKDIENLKVLIEKEAHREYFLSDLDNPAWFEYLRDWGWFDRFPEPEVEE